MREREREREALMRLRVHLERVRVCVYSKATEIAHVYVYTRLFNRRIAREIVLCNRFAFCKRKKKQRAVPTAFTIIIYIYICERKDKILCGVLLT